MMRFTPPTEITPEPTPEFVLNYDASCLPSVTAVPTPTPSPTPPQNEDESGWLVGIPPLEGEFQLLTPIELNMLVTASEFDPLLAPNEIFTYSDGTKLISVYKTLAGNVRQYDHILPDYMLNPKSPSWGVVNAQTNHYRLAFTCDVIPFYSRICYWDSLTDTFHILINMGIVSGIPQISPDGSRIAYGDLLATRISVLDLATNISTQISTTIVRYPRWSDSNELYYFQTPNTRLLRSDGAIILENIANLQPSNYDVRFRELLYWQLNELYHWDNGQNNSVIISPLGYFPVHWSPRTDEIRNQLILLAPSSNDLNKFCVFLLGTDGLIIAEITCEMSNFAVDWASGVDLDFLIPPQQYTCLNPDTSAPDIDNINRCINELAEYGIIAYADGLPTTNPHACVAWVLGTQYSQAWTLEELQQILMGVQDTAKAFYMVENGIYASSDEVQSLTGFTEGEKAIFKNVMKPVPLCNDAPLEGFYLLRVNSSFIYKPVDPQNPNEERDKCEGSSNEACTSNANHTIAFYGTFYRKVAGQTPLAEHELIKYIFVHELGHRFNNQTDANSPDVNTSLKNIYVDNRNKTTIYDCNELIVMGAFSETEWTRGVRGWGDVAEPNVVPSVPGMQFQQHSLNPQGKTDEEIDEATADMFLNWVYRRITDRWSDPINGLVCGLPSFNSSDWSGESSPSVDETWEILETRLDWEGFRNIAPDWVNNAYNYNVTIYDFDLDFNIPGEEPVVDRASLSGNARYWWMDNVMRTIFGLSMNDSWR